MASDKGENNIPKSDGRLLMKYLPGYAAFLQQNKWHAYACEAFRNLNEEEVPLFQLLKKRKSGEELFDIIYKESNSLLTALAGNKVNEYIRESTIVYTEKFVPLFEKEAVVAEDITLLSFVRRKSLLKFLPLYTKDMQLCMDILEEIDRFISSSELASFTAYIKINQEKINRINTELAQRQEELFEAEELAGMGSFFWDFEGKNTRFTPGFRKILNISTVDNMNNFLEKVHPDDREGFQKALDNALSHQGMFDYEYRYIIDEEEKNIWARGSVTFDEEKLKSMKGTIMDFTKKHKLIQQLRRSERMHEKVQALTHLGNWTWTIGDNKITWSDELYRIYGLKPQSQEITFDFFIDLIHPDDRENRIREIQESLEKKRADDYTMRIVNPDGTEKILKGKGELILDDHNEPLKLVGTCQDITSEYKLNRALKEHDAYLKQLINNAPDAVIVTDTKSIITLWNPKAEEIFGWREEEALGKSLNETVIPPQHREAHNAGMKRLLDTGVAKILNKTVELTALNKKGIEFNISLTISKFVQEGQLLFVAFLRNITEEKRTKAELQEKSKELVHLNRSLHLKNNALESINKELESFNYVVSHDLQEPLRKIQIFANRMIEKAADELTSSTTQYLEKIIGSSQRMKQLIEDLLIFSQTTARKDNFQEVDLNVVLNEVRSILGASVEENKVIIEKSTPLPTLAGVHFQLQQLLLNLISNAIKYARENVTPHIKISSSTVQGGNAKGAIGRGHVFFEIKVEDNGIGFNPDYTNKIFDLFQRLHHRDEYSGTGIGLAICKKIAHNHNGYIKAEGFPGKGSVFYVYLPK